MYGNTLPSISTYLSTLSTIATEFDNDEDVKLLDPTSWLLLRLFNYLRVPVLHDDRMSF